MKPIIVNNIISPTSGGYVIIWRENKNGKQHNTFTWNTDKWIKALRSGKYKQSSGRLCSNRGYCPWGVLYSVTGYLNGLSSCFAHIPYLKRIELEISEATYHKILILNDQKHKSFKEIADFLETKTGIELCARKNSTPCRF